MSSVRDLRSRGRAMVRDHAIDPRDADLLLAHVLGKTTTWLIAHDSDQVARLDRDAYIETLQRRVSGEPVQYIRGTCEFYGREMIVDSRVLIPRPETEHLVETVLARIPRGGRVLDVGTGSGCIAVALKCERPDLELIASDVSFDALQVARANAAAHGAHVTLVGADVLGPFVAELDAIVSNPPYIRGEDVPSLQREVRDWEPMTALTPGGDGLRVIERLLTDAPGLLAATGFLAMEIGFDQKEDVERLAEKHRWADLELVNDLAGHPRVAILNHRGSRLGARG